MPLYTYGGVLLKSGSGLTADGNCCCGSGPECNCFIDVSEAAGCCDCLDVAFGADSTKPAAGVRVQGTPTFRGVVPFSCAAIDQLFLANCGDPKTIWWYHQARGTTFIGGVLHYIYQSYRVSISYCADGLNAVVGVGGQLQFEIRSMLLFVTAAQTEDTWVTDPISGNPESVDDIYKRTTYGLVFDTGLNRDWRYALTGACTTECNEYYQWPDCASTITFTESQPDVGIADFWEKTCVSCGRCDVTELTLTPYSANNP